MEYSVLFNNFLNDDFWKIGNLGCHGSYFSRLVQNNLSLLNFFSGSFVLDGIFEYFS